MKLLIGRMALLVAMASLVATPRVIAQAPPTALGHQVGLTPLRLALPVGLPAAERIRGTTEGSATPVAPGFANRASHARAAAPVSAGRLLLGALIGGAAGAGICTWIANDIKDVSNRFVGCTTKGYVLSIGAGAALGALLVVLIR
ncbi:MAG: hypothetical protein V4558_13575 [Gemmatimonadota bacterium]